ncbi:MAG: cellulose biosynthesis protein BcsS [Xanthobacteraceae bacterium]|nr:cellulose biosynthesis protein BcsS [Xanthobacteraceae bacterium]
MERHITVPCICYVGPGFTLKILLAGGQYVYPSSGLRMDVAGTLASASALPGWRMTRDGLTVGLYAGPIVQDYRLMPYDPGSVLRGSYAGGQIAADIWYRPDPATMNAFYGSIASIGLVGSARAANGWRSAEPFFIGPEAQALWCVDYQQLRIGAHVTGLRVDALEWSASSGWAVECFRRAGPYVRLGFNTRY